MATRLSFLCFCVLLLAFSSNARSNEAEAAAWPERNDTVKTRSRPELEPLGIRAGGFKIYPELGYRLSRDDNIFAEDADAITDIISNYSAALTAASDFSRHAVNLSASANLGRYREYKTENYDDWQVAGNVRLDISRASKLLAGASHFNLHEPRDSPDNIGGFSPTLYTLDLATVNFIYRPGLVYVEPVASYKRYEYEEVEALVQGVPVVVNQDDRNRDEIVAGLRAGIDKGPDRKYFVELYSFTTDYDQLQKLTGLDRSSDGHEISAGMVHDLRGVFRGRIAFGYRKQFYTDPLPDISAPVFNIGLVWKPTELTTVELDAVRSFAETTAFLYSGYISTLTNLRVDHELLRNLLLHADLGHRDDDYKGINASTREDRTLSTSLGMEWLVNRNLTVSLRHEYTQRDTVDSTVPPGFTGDNFQRNVSWFGLELKQ